MPMQSAAMPCKGGKTAPPSIIIIKMDEASAVRFSRPSIAKVKTFDHIMELKSPTASNDHNATSPERLIEAAMRTIFTKAKTASKREGMPFPK